MDMQIRSHNSCGSAESHGDQKAIERIFMFIGKFCETIGILFIHRERSNGPE